LRLEAMLVLLLAVPVVSAQTSGTSSSSSTTSSSTSGASGQTGQKSGGSQQRDEADSIASVAPPFDVEDVRRMHRVGLQDEVIINALRARFHPLKLSAADRSLLEKDSVSTAVISAIEDPFGTGLKASALPAPLSTEDKKTADVALVPTPESKAVAVVPAAKDATVASVPVTPGKDESPKAGAPPEAGPSVASTSTPTPTPPVHDDVQLSAADIASSDIPTVPGVYRWIPGGGWEAVTTEDVKWKHDKHDATKHVEGTLPGTSSKTTILQGRCDILVVTEGNEAIVQFELLGLHLDHATREFHPQAGGAAFGNSGAEAVPFDPQKITPAAWLIPLHRLPHGDYGFLPPAHGQLQSTTGFSSTIFTFHVI